MIRFFAFLSLLFLLSCKTTTYIIVRHAEKDTSVSTTTDVPLSPQGQKRADALAQLLKERNVRYIFATNYKRTIGTAQPLASLLNLPVQTYNPMDSTFISSIKSLTKGNVLIVGHSNTVDNLVNDLMGITVVPADLQDNQYGDLFVVKKTGNKYKFERSFFGNL